MPACDTAQPDLTRSLRRRSRIFAGADRRGSYEPGATS
jgi:hypothetical protein